jgi:hypothetical protein
MVSADSVWRTETFSCLKKTQKIKIKTNIDDCQNTCSVMITQALQASSPLYQKE